MTSKTESAHTPWTPENVERIQVTWDSERAAYFVSIPCWDGGSVVATLDFLRLHQQRDELLEALEELLAAPSKGYDIVGQDTDGHPLSAEGVARTKARAAIARAKGQV